MRRTGFRWLRLWLCAVLCLPTAALAVDGYDHYHHTRVTIVAGDRIAAGEDLGVYIWESKTFRPVEVLNLVRRGDDLELEVLDRKHNHHFFFEIRADDPGLDLLPEFSPGLPYPEVLSPELHQKHDLLEARGDMTDRGNLVEQGNRLEQGNQLERGNLLEGPEPHPSDHLLYQGFQPVE